MRHSFDNEMKTIHHRIIRMAVSLENSVKQAMKAVKSCDMELALEIVAGDDFYDEMQKEVETLCIHTILRRQPVAIDLRKLFAVIKIVTDLERIADHCADLAELILRNQDDAAFRFHPLMEKMTNDVIAMLQMVIEGYIGENAERCRDVVAADDVVDADFETLKSELALQSQNHANHATAPSHATAYFSALIAGKYLERMGDHTTNIAEWILWALDC